MVFKEEEESEEEAMNGALVFDGDFMFFVSRMDIVVLSCSIQPLSLIISFCRDANLFILQNAIMF